LTRPTGPRAFVALRDSAALALTRFGYSAIPLAGDAGTVLCVDGSLFRITRGCMYASFALTLLPVTWRVQRCRAANLLGAPRSVGRH